MSNLTQYHVRANLRLLHHIYSVIVWAVMHGTLKSLARNWEPVIERQAAINQDRRVS